MQRRVALKVPPPKKLAGPGMMQRFIREAQALAALDHPNIVRAHDLEKFGKLYMLAMEYVDGPNLRDLVIENGPLPAGRAAHYIAQAAQGLQHAHEAGWVHRDIKPANLLVDQAGVVKVLDLGLAYLLGEDVESPTRKFDDNAVLGTADYLAPEQAIDSHEVDIRADIYSLGATMYFTLTGRTPFEGSTIAQKLMAHQVAEPTPVSKLRPDVPQGLALVLAKMMAKSPADRYQTPAEVAQALIPFTSDADLAPPRRKDGSTVIRRTSEPTLASTLHARTRSGKTTRNTGHRVVTWFNRLDTKSKAAVGFAAGSGLLLTGVLLAFLFRGHKAGVADRANASAQSLISPRPGPTASAGERLVFQAHRGIAECVRLLPDGRFVTAGDDRVIRLWDAGGRQIVRQLEGHTETVRTVTTVPTDGRLLVSAARDGTLRLWDLESGAELRRFIGHVGQVWCGDVSPDGRRLLSCGQDKTVRLWDLRTGVEVRKLLAHADTATSVAFLPDGHRAVSCGIDKSVRLWNTQTGVELNSIALPDRAYRLTISPDGQRVVVGCRSEAHVWDLETDKVTVFDASMDRGFYLEQARFAPDGRWLLGGGSDGVVRLWNVATGRELAPIRALVKGKVLEVIWGAEGRSFAVSCGDGTIHVWNWSQSDGA
jgi:WD40 repeat protein/serine/threonine protein kinase